MSDELVVPGGVEEARVILRDSATATWGSRIKHSEPKIIVSVAILATDFAERIDTLANAMIELRDRLDAVEEALS